MDKLPPEIHELIFSFACTAPSTSASLALVSKYFRDTSQPFKWQCVALNGCNQVLKFARAIGRGERVKSPSYGSRCKALLHRRSSITAIHETAVVYRRPPIYHLFLSDRGSHRYVSRPSNCDPAHFASQYVSRYSQFLPAFREILFYAAPTLTTFSLFSDSFSFDENVSSLQTVLSSTFPQLRELTLRACCTPAQVMGLVHQKHFQCNMPALQRLHLALPYHGFDNGNLGATHRLVRTIARNAYPTGYDSDVEGEEHEQVDMDVTPDADSAFSHLRFTMLDKWGSKRVVEVIHAELAELKIVTPSLTLPAPPSDWDIPLSAVASRVTWARLLPPRLALFAIQPSPTSTFYCSCCMDLRGDVDVMRILERMAEVADKERFLCLDRRPINVRRCRTDPMEVAGYGFAEARMDWLERMEGGGGCWRLREDFDCDDVSPLGSPPAAPSPIPATMGKRGGHRPLISRFGNALKRFKIW